MADPRIWPPWQKTRMSNRCMKSAKLQIHWPYLTWRAGWAYVDEEKGAKHNRGKASCWDAESSVRAADACSGVEHSQPVPEAELHRCAVRLERAIISVCKRMADVASAPQLRWCPSFPNSGSSATMMTCRHFQLGQTSQAVWCTWVIGIIFGDTMVPKYRVRLYPPFGVQYFI